MLAQADPSTAEAKSVAETLTTASSMEQKERLPVLEGSRFGIAIAAMIKMIATTMSNSINEKPELARACALEPIVPTSKKIKPPVCSTARSHLWTDCVSLAFFHQSPYCAATMVTISSLPARYMCNFAELARTWTFERSSSL